MAMVVPRDDFSKDAFPKSVNSLFTSRNRERDIIFTGPIPSGDASTVALNA